MTATRRTGYSPQEIEPKWQRVWVERGVMKASESSPKPKKEAPKRGDMNL